MPITTDATTGTIFDYGTWGNFYTLTDEPLYTVRGNTIAADRINIAANTDMDVLNARFEEFARKVYKIIEEHTNIDISEKEFMDLLKDDD